MYRAFLLELSVTSQMQINVRMPGREDVAASVEPADTIEAVKRKLGLNDVKLWLGRTFLKNADTLEKHGVQAGQTLNAVPQTIPDGFKSKGEYLAHRRLQTNVHKTSRVHAHLHERTVSVAMTEGERTRTTVENRCDVLEDKVDKLLEYHEKVPPSNPGDLDLMEKVLNKFKVGMMNDILQQFKIDRPAGVKREGKAALIVKNVPRTDLLKLLEERPSPSMGTMETASASSSQPARGPQAYFGGAASGVQATDATCTAMVKSGKRKGQHCGSSLPCKRHKNTAGETKWHLKISPPVPGLWNTIHARFAKAEVTPAAEARCETADTECSRRPTQLEVEPSLSVLLESVCANGATVCGRPKRSGSPCRWSAADRECPHHNPPQFESRAMHDEDFRSHLVERGVCGVVMSNGRSCENVRGECRFHATDDARRCESSIEKDPTVRCKRPRQEGSSFCPYHQGYPNLSKNLKDYVDEVGVPALRSNFKEVLGSFCKRFYPSRADPLPDVEPFFVWYFRPAAATSNGTFESD